MFKHEKRRFAQPRGAIYAELKD